MTKPTYFHGGKPGLKRGMFLLPPKLTGEPSCSEYGAAGIHRRDRVYLTTDHMGALLFAAMHPSDKGTVYECEPVGEVEPDPDWHGEPGASVQVERARILHVHRVYPSTRKLMRRQFVEASGLLPEGAPK